MKLKRSELTEPAGTVTTRVKSGDLPVRELDIVSEDVSIRLKIHPIESDLRIEGAVSARLRETCDRCLMPYEINVEPAFELMLAHDDDDNLLRRTDDLDIYPFPANQDEFDLGPVIRDAMILEQSMKKICKEDCKGLCPSCGINLNKSKCNCRGTEIDERWSILKTIDFSNMEE